LTQDVIRRYLDFGQADRWGKARRPNPDLSQDGEACVRRLAEEIGDLVSQLTGADLATGADVDFRCIGFQLLGPGGGPWTVIVPARGPAIVKHGLVEHPTVLLQMTVKSLHQWLASDYVQRRQTTSLWLRRRDSAFNAQAATTPTSNIATAPALRPKSQQ